MPAMQSRFGTALLLSCLTYHEGEIGLFVVAINQSQLPITLDFPTEQTHDFALFNGKGEEYWRWSTDKVFAQVPKSITIQAGRFHVLDLVLEELPLPSGPRPPHVRVIGELLSTSLSSRCEQSLPIV